MCDFVKRLVGNEIVLLCIVRLVGIEVGENGEKSSIKKDFQTELKDEKKDATLRMSKDQRVSTFYLSFVHVNLCS